jgi:hypothetical protein
MFPAISGGQQPYQLNRQGQFAANSANAQMKNQMITGLIQTGVGASAQLGSAAIMSSRTFKKNIDQLSEAEEDALFERLTNTPLYRWQYKTEPDSQARHLGMVTEEALPEIVTEDGKHLSIIDYFGVVTLALKVINRKLDKQSMGAK